MVYLCAKFGNFSFSCFGFIVQTESQTGEGAVPPPQKFWTSKWPVSVHCGMLVGVMHPPITPGCIQL